MSQTCPSKIWNSPRWVGCDVDWDETSLGKHDINGDGTQDLLVSGKQVETGGAKNGIIFSYRMTLRVPVFAFNLRMHRLSAVQAHREHSPHLQ